MEYRGEVLKADLKDRVALITGSTGHIGSAIALSYAQNGAHVMVNGRNEEKGMKVVEEIRGMGRKADFFKADVSSSQAVEEMVTRTIEVFGKVDILVNNSGGGTQKEDRKPIYQFSDSEWQRVIGLNLHGVFYCSKAVSKYMVEKRQGVIINIGSVVGAVPFRLQCAYATAKAGVHNLTRAMALDLAQYSIRVNGILPGSILTKKTELLFYSDPEVGKRQCSNIPQRRPGKSEEIASAALFLASDASSYMTGSIVTVDGGWICGASGPQHYPSLFEGI